MAVRAKLVKGCFESSPLQSAQLSGKPADFSFGRVNMHL